jgi:hypothetical protein
MKALFHPVWRQVIFGMLAGAVAAFPVCVWGPGEFYRPAWIVLVVCCWGPALIMGVFDRLPV